MPALTDLRDQACIVGIGETDPTRGTPKSALELALEASLGAIEDVGIQPGDIDAVSNSNRARISQVRRSRRKPTTCQRGLWTKSERRFFGPFG